MLESIAHCEPALRTSCATRHTRDWHASRPEKPVRARADGGLGGRHFRHRRPGLAVAPRPSGISPPDPYQIPPLQRRFEHPLARGGQLELEIHELNVELRRNDAPSPAEDQVERQLRVGGRGLLPPQLADAARNPPMGRTERSSAPPSDNGFPDSSSRFGIMPETDRRRSFSSCSVEIVQVGARMSRVRCEQQDSRLTQRGSTSDSGRPLASGGGPPALSVLDKRQLR